MTEAEMKKHLTYALIAITLLILAGCAHVSNKQSQPVMTPQVAVPAGAIPIGTYKYTALDQGGKVIAAGELYITAATNDSVTGTWEIKTAAPQEKTGPQNGKGNIHGSVEPKLGLIYLDLNPDMKDNNIVLTGIFKDGKLSGAWGWYGKTAEKVKGSFVAELKLFTK
jgi:hypothetical protein